MQRYRPRLLVHARRYSFKNLGHDDRLICYDQDLRSPNWQKGVRSHLGVIYVRCCFPDSCRLFSRVSSPEKSVCGRFHFYEHNVPTPQLSFSCVHSVVHIITSRICSGRSPPDARRPAWGDPTTRWNFEHNLAISYTPRCGDAKRQLQLRNWMYCRLYQ